MHLQLEITTKALHGAFVVLAVAAATAVAAPRIGEENAVLTSSQTGTFQIKGQVAGLYPGGTVTLPLTVVNKNGFKIAVKTVTVTVVDASAACPASALTATAYRGKLVVPAKRSAQLTVRATLSAAAPDECAGAQFPLRYRGTAVKA